MTLTNERKKQYRTIGHNLNPVVTVADKGLTDGVLEELDRALNDHELIKIKLVIADRDLRKETVETICKKTRSELIQEIGKVALIFRAAKKPNPKLTPF